MTAGAQVRILAPFAVHFPGVYTIAGRNEETGAWTVEGIGDFDEKFLEVVS